MQYGAKLSTYERTLKAKKKEEKKTVDGQLVIKLLIYFISSILVSRVLLINYIAPFGIAFLVAVLIYGEEKVPLVAGGGTLIGYVSLIGTIDALPSYIVLIAVITLTAYLTKNIGRRKQLLVMFSLIFIEVIAYKYFISKLTLDIAALSAALEAGCIFPLYFIINYSIVCFKNLNTKHLFTNEEVISMAVTASLVISGTWGVNIAGVSIRNILALLFIVVISYVKGSTVGAASGVAMGVIIGVCSNNLPIYISVYGLCGLIGGLFKNSGKLLTVLSYIVAFAIIKIYSNIQGEFKIIEVLIS